MYIDTKIEKLIDISICLSSETNLKSLLEKIVFELRKIINADGGSLYLREDDSLYFEVAQNDTLKRIRGKDFQLFKPYKLKIDDASIAGYVAFSGTSLNISNVYHLPTDLPYHFDPSFDTRNDYRTQSLLAVPLKCQKGEIVGVLQLINAQDENGRIISFPAHEEKLVTALASQAAVAINNARLLKSLEILRAAESKLYHSHLEAIFQSVKDAIITLGLDFKVLAVNEAAYDICGLDPQKILGQNFLKAVEDCQKTCSEVLNDFENSRDQVQEYYQECHRLSQPHQTVCVTRAPLKDHDDKCNGMVLVIRDLTGEIDLKEDLCERYRHFDIIGRGLTMQKVYRILDDLLPTDTTVLISGETGTGKELVACALHYGGPRANKPMVKVNCTALAETLLESELFGHVKGAFTGAHKDRIGRFQKAEGGTIFLDEVGDMDLKTQAKLLRVIEEKKFERVGESITRQADVRIIAATHQDLRKMVDKGRFRQDLYYRLKVFEVNLPPLKERLDDLPQLVKYFHHLFNKIYKKHVEGFLPEVWKIFRSYSWPGNVRELKHVLEHAFVHCRGSTIKRDDLPAEIIQAAPKLLAIPKKKSFSSQVIMEVLTLTDWNKAKTARFLKISRPTLYRLIAEYNLAEPIK